MRSTNLALDCGAADRLVPIDDAFAAIAGDTTAVPEIERIPLGQAAGRVIAEDVATRIALPPFDHSAVDGYGLTAAEIGRTPPYRLRAIGRLAAGGSTNESVGPGEALRVFTGAALPPEIAAVIPEERCVVEGATIVIATLVPDSANIRRQGEDVGSGSAVVEGGTLLDARHVAILAATGVSVVAVRRRVRVAILSTGTELRSAGEPLDPRAIYDSNRPMLAALLVRPWIEIVDVGRFADEADELAAAFDWLPHQADIVVSTGGAAGSETDHIKRAIIAAGGFAEAFHLALRPGKPLVFGRIGTVPILGLPGNPVAALVNFLLFGRALILGLAGGRIARPRGQAARTVMPFSHTPGRTEFVPAKIVGFDSEGHPQLEKLGRGGSARLRPLVLADGLAEIPAEASDLTPGAAVAFHSFYAAFAP